MICNILQDIKPSSKQKYTDLIKFVDDRPGHDKRYAINSSKIQEQIGWKAQMDFKIGLRETVLWYVNNYNWLEQSIKK